MDIILYFYKSYKRDNPSKYTSRYVKYLHHIHLKYLQPFNFQAINNNNSKVFNFYLIIT